MVYVQFMSDGGGGGGGVHTHSLTRVDVIINELES